MRTHALALNGQTRQKLSITHMDAGALYVDEYSKLQGELNHAELGFANMKAAINDPGMMKNVMEMMKDPATMAEVRRARARDSAARNSAARNSAAQFSL